MEHPHNSTQESLEDFLKRHPHIKYATPYSPDYAYAGTTFIVNSAKPLAIVRPQTSDDVAALVSCATSNGIKLVIRSGGHDLFGRSKIEGALMVDMRDIKFVEVDPSQQSAKIGGGIIASHLASVLSQHGLTTAFGTVPDVGYVGWATLGGYGHNTANYGLGVDQIVSAKVVNWEGEVVDAGERMLQGIRGAGGNFGVIVELGVKVYPEPKMFGGTIFYDSQDISKAFREYVKAYREMDIALNLPESLPLAVQPFVRNSPLQGRKSFGVELCWTGHGEDEAAARIGQNFIQKFAKLGITIESTVKSTAPADWLRDHASPSGLYGGLRTISIRQLTDQVTEVIGRYLEIMPEDPATCFSLHQLRGPAASPNPSSVFGSREPHFVLEFIATTITEVNMRASLVWAEEFRSALLQSDPENLLQGEYVPLSPPGTVPVSRMYGPYYETLRELKQEFDPKGIFDLAVPRLGN